MRISDWSSDVCSSDLYAIEFEPTYFVSDALSLNAGFYADRSPDWLVWQHDNLIGSFEGRAWHFNAGLDWNIGSRQELRVKLQPLAIDAPARQAWREDASGNPGASEALIKDLSVRYLGLEITFRDQLAPVHYLCRIDGRTGSRRNNI